MPVIGWDQFLKTTLGGLAGLLALALGLVVLMNPYGHLPLRVFGAHAIMDSNQRFQYPAIARSGAFDSAVIGTSTSRLLDPDRLDAGLGGHFANLAMNAARAWEQYRLARLFLDYQPKPKTLLIALDGVWCDQKADTDRVTPRGFPEWLYDKNPWNDWLYLLNLDTLEFSGRMAAHRLGLRPPRIPANGFEVFVPPATAYDPIKAQHNLQKAAPAPILPTTPPYAVTEEDIRSWRYPALDWLDELLAATPPSTRRLLVFMPIHVVIQPVPGSREAARERICKSHIAEIGKRRDALVIDFRIRSALTTNDTNYWDPQHYRLPIALRIVDGIAHAVATGRDDPEGDWVLHPQPGSHAEH
jgi:hypothetical protein